MSYRLTNSRPTGALFVGAFLLTAASLWSAPARAVCNPSTGTGVPFDCESGGIPQPNDLFFGGSNNGATRGHSVSFTGADMIAMDHSNAPVTATGGPAKTLGNWMAQLQALGGSGSGVVAQGTAGQLGYYASSGGVLSPLPTAANAVVSTTSSGAVQESTTLPPGLTIPNPVFTGTITGLPASTGGGGSGTVSSGLANNLAFYPGTGTTIQGLATSPNGVLVTNASSVPGISSTLPAGLTIPSPTFTGTVTGLPSSGGGGSGTINSAAQGLLAYYSAAGTTLSGLATVPSGVLATNTNGTPSITASLPANLHIPTPGLTGPIAIAGAAPTAYTVDGADMTLQSNVPANNAVVIYGDISGCGASAGCKNFESYRSVITVPSGSTETNTSSYGSYLLNLNPTGGTGQNAVNFFGVGISGADYTQTWGVNMNLSDSTSQGYTQVSHGRVLANEMDYNVTSTNTTVYGMVLQGNSYAQPAAATGFMVSPLSLSQQRYQWQQAFLSANNAAVVALQAGTSAQPTTANLASQVIAFVSTDNNTNQVVTEFYAAGGGNLQATAPVQMPYLIMQTASSPNSGAACQTGTLEWDANYLYICYASGAWKRAQLNGY